MILFLSHYPDKETIKDGMSQRISNIDTYFSTDVRIYLDISFTKHIKKQMSINKDKTVIKCNFFMHLYLILNALLLADKVYIHSAYNVLKIIPFIPFVKKDYILDLHGVVPEENFLEGNKFNYHLYNFCEKIIFNKVKLVICVTDAMKTHYVTKFPKSRALYFVYPILPNTILEDFEFQTLDKNNNLINIVYSGNTQKWQNIELMSEIIARNLFPNIKYYILTGNVEDAKKQINKKIDLNSHYQIKILSVKPEELKAYYEKCHYGFILRDDIVVNNVSCPTKLIEYMHYGLTPIILSPNIGDFKQLGYEYIDSNVSFFNLPLTKSYKNHQIVNQMASLTAKVNFRNQVFC